MEVDGAAEDDGWDVDGADEDGGGGGAAGACSGDRWRRLTLL